MNDSYKLLPPAPENPETIQLFPNVVGRRNASPCLQILSSGNFKGSRIDKRLFFSSIAPRLWFQHAISTPGRNWDLPDDHFAERRVPEAETARSSDELS